MPRTGPVARRPRRPDSLPCLRRFPGCCHPRNQGYHPRLRGRTRLHPRGPSLISLEAMALMLKERDHNRHIEFFAFPHGDRALVKRLNITIAAPTVPVEPGIDENELVEFAANTARQWPWINSCLQCLVSMFIEDTTCVADSFAIFPSERSVPVNEMEPSVPAARGKAARPARKITARADSHWRMPGAGRDNCSGQQRLDAGRADTGRRARGIKYARYRHSCRR
ncbi:MAG TPA: hypothetical protein DF427_09675 [Moraxellaceae bacterium]|nr:hypothetical protein [Moraxellaceae bacterium]